MGEIRELLARLDAGDAAAQADIESLLRPAMQAMLRERLGAGTLATASDAGALVQRSWTRLVEAGMLDEPHRGPYLEHASRMMQDVAMQLAGRAASQAPAVAEQPRSKSKELDAGKAPAGRAGATLAQTAQAVAALQALDEGLARIVRLRWFAAASFGDIAAWLGRDEAGVEAAWRKARAFLSAVLPTPPAAAAAAPSQKGSPGSRAARGSGKGKRARVAAAPSEKPDEA